MANVYSHKMITFENPKVGNRISLSDLKAPNCHGRHGFCLHLEFYGKDLSMKKELTAAMFQMSQGSRVKNPAISAP